MILFLTALHCSSTSKYLYWNRGGHGVVKFLVIFTLLVKVKHNLHFKVLFPQGRCCCHQCMLYIGCVVMCVLIGKATSSKREIH